jgi:hypothetical protein
MGESFFFFSGNGVLDSNFIFQKDEPKTAEANRLLMAVEREKI